MPFAAAERRTIVFSERRGMDGGDGMAEWWSIEVFSGDKLPASGWRYAYEDELTEAAITHGALYYEWHDTAVRRDLRGAVPRPTSNGRRSARCPPSAPRSTECPTRSTACSSTAAGAARRARPSRASPSPRPARPRSSWRSREERRRGSCRLRTRRKAIRRAAARAARSGRRPGAHRARIRSIRRGSCPTGTGRRGAISPASDRSGRLEQARLYGHPGGEPRPRTVQDGGMTETRVMTEDLRAADRAQRLLPRSGDRRGRLRPRARNRSPPSSCTTTRYSTLGWRSAGT